MAKIAFNGEVNWGNNPHQQPMKISGCEKCGAPMPSGVCSYCHPATRVIHRAERVKAPFGKKVLALAMVGFAGACLFCFGAGVAHIYHWLCPSSKPSEQVSHLRLAPESPQEPEPLLPIEEPKESVQPYVPPAQVSPVKPQSKPEVEYAAPKSTQVIVERAVIFPSHVPSPSVECVCVPTSCAPVVYSGGVVATGFPICVHEVHRVRVAPHHCETHHPVHKPHHPVHHQTVVNKPPKNPKRHS